jgi:hypothetical protein
LSDEQSSELRLIEKHFSGPGQFDGAADAVEQLGSLPRLQNPAWRCWPRTTASLNA